MWNDPIVAEVRRIREELAARHQYDIHEICREARQGEKQSSHSIVSFSPKPAITTVAPSGHDTSVNFSPNP